MKRITVFILTLVILASFTSCGKKLTDTPYVEPETEVTEEESAMIETTTEEPTTEETTVEETTEEAVTDYQPDRSDFTDANVSGVAELLEACYKARFDPELSGHILRDLNGDGQSEMLAFERVPAKNGSAKTTVLYYMTVTDNRVIISDVLTQDYIGDGAATKDIYDNTTHGDYRGEAQEVFITDESVICITRFMSHMAWSANYDLYKIEHGKFVWIKGITDPGYTSGIGLYLDNEDGYDYENGKLYETGDGEIVEGSRYDSYKKAINAELNPYGFSLYKNGQDGHGGSGKYQISETAKVKKIYGFSIYATVEELDIEDNGI